MENVKNESSTKFNGTAADAKSSVQKFGQNMSHQLDQMSHDAGERIGSMASSISDSASRYVQGSRDYVRHNPVKSIALATAAGLVAGSVLTLVMRRRD
jgi:ElaB/YqjD/DUF883 family membrane-anchored ribosome-binding protein